MLFRSFLATNLRVLYAIRELPDQEKDCKFAQNVKIVT